MNNLLTGENRPRLHQQKFKLGKKHIEFENYFVQTSDQATQNLRFVCKAWCTLKCIRYLTSHVIYDICGQVHLDDCLRGLVKTYLTKLDPENHLELSNQSMVNCLHKKHLEYVLPPAL